MYKLKTKKSVLKRMKLSKGGKGKVRRSRAFKSHLMRSMSPKRKRQLRRPGFVTGKQSETMRQLILPNY